MSPSTQAAVEAATAAQQTLLVAQRKSRDARTALAVDQQAAQDATAAEGQAMADYLTAQAAMLAAVEADAQAANTAAGAAPVTP